MIASGGTRTGKHLAGRAKASGTGAVVKAAHLQLGQAVAAMPLTTGGLANVAVIR